MEPAISEERIRELLERARQEKMTPEEFQRALDALLEEATGPTKTLGEPESVREERIKATAKKARRLQRAR